MDRQFDPTSWHDPRPGAVEQLIKPTLFLIRLSARLSPDGEAFFGGTVAGWRVTGEAPTDAGPTPLVSRIADWQILPKDTGARNAQLPVDAGVSNPKGGKFLPLVWPLSGIGDLAVRDLGWAMADCARTAFEPLAPRINADILTSRISEPKIFIDTSLELLASAGRVTWLEEEDAQDSDGVRAHAVRLVFEAGLAGKLWPITDCIPEDMPVGLLDSNDLSKQIWPETGRTIAQRYNGEVDALFEAIRSSVGAL